MVCDHLAELEQDLVAADIPITYRGQPWSSNCREWVYFACWLDRPAIRSHFTLADCVHEHDHLGTHDGQEAGLVCSECNDAIMGAHATHRANLPTFP
jgi:deoxyribodipyrimidine photolyase